MLESSGIQENGPNPWDFQVHNPQVYARTLMQGSVGLGEAYMEGWWDCAALDEFFVRVLKMKLGHRVRGLPKWKTASISRMQNMQNKWRSKTVAEVHYDVGNDLYSKMLDARMLYSCAYWARAQTLEEAQEAKLDLIACKLDLQPGMRILDIGCGWGGACQYFAERYGVQVVGITLSAEQATLARERCAGHAVEILLQDYRDLPANEQFDAIYSIGMFEHVGYKNYRAFMQRVHNWLPSHGRFLLHTIGGKVSMTHADPWVNKYIFPHGMLPSAAQIGSAIDGLLVLEDWHCFGLDYDRTLMQWLARFEGAWDTLRHAYDERFYRMWRYYLSVCAASFRVRDNQLWQVLLVRDGLREPPPACR